MGQIKIVVLENLTAEDLLKLKQGGFFDGVSASLPAGVIGQSATLRVPEAATSPTESATTEKESAKPRSRKLREEVAAAATTPIIVPVPTPAEVIKATKEQDVEPLVESPKAIGTVDLAKLSTYTKLRDALQFILDSGIPAAEVQSYCESVKDKVPLLTRINIPERVARTLEVMTP